LQRAQMSAVMRAALGIIRSHFEQILALLRGELANRLGRRTDDEATVRKAFALGDERAGADQTAFADDGTVEHHGLYSDERPVAHRAAMHHGLMADRNLLADRQRKTRIGMQHRGILYVAVRTDADDLVIPPEGGAEPYRGVLSEDDFSDHRRVGRDV